MEEEEDHTYELLLTAETKIPTSIPECQSGKSKRVVQSFCFHTLFSSVLVRILKCCPNQASVLFNLYNVPDMNRTCVSEDWRHV